jgi:hypothetical protein
MCRSDLEVALTKLGSDDKLQELLTVLEALVSFLALYEERYWEVRLNDDLRLLRTGDPQGLETLLAGVDGNGGGRLAELFIGPENGHRVRLDEVAGANKRLSNLRTEVRRRALALKHAIEGREHTGKGA